MAGRIGVDRVREGLVGPIEFLLGGEQLAEPEPADAEAGLDPDGFRE